MRKKTTLKGFTLIEMMIVIVIIGILAVVLTESYITISRTALRIEQEKNISEESLILTQIFQSIADEATIDYEEYKNSENPDLEESNGFTNILYLTGGQWSGTSIYTTGNNCLDLYEDFPKDTNGNYIDYSEKIQNALSGCWLEMRQETDDDPIITQLTTPGKVIISEVKFKIIPFDSDEDYFEKAGDGDVLINNLHQPAFRMFIHLYAPFYQPIGTNKIDQPLQLFFNLNL